MTRHFFLLTLYTFKNIPPGPPAPRSLNPEKRLQCACSNDFTKSTLLWFHVKRAQHCCTTLRLSQNNRNVDLLHQGLTSFKLYCNKCQHCCRALKKQIIYKCRYALKQTQYKVALLKIFPVVLSRFSVSLPKNYQYAVIRVQYKVELLTRFPVVSF